MNLQHSHKTSSGANNTNSQLWSDSRKQKKNINKNENDDEKEEKKWEKSKMDETGFQSSSESFSQ
jgi:hypothetical protein